MKSAACTTLDPTRRSTDAREFEAALRRKIVGQDAAVEKVAEIYQMFLAGLNPPGTSDWQPAISWTHRFGKNSRGRSSG